MIDQNSLADRVHATFPSGSVRVTYEEFGTVIRVGGPLIFDSHAISDVEYNVTGNEAVNRLVDESVTKLQKAAIEEFGLQPLIDELVTKLVHDALRDLGKGSL